MRWKSRTGVSLWLIALFTSSAGAEFSDWARVILADSADAYHISLAMDSNNNPHILYSPRYGNSLRYAFHDGQTWRSSTIVNSNPDLIINAAPPLMIDTSGNVSTSYIENGQLVLTAWDGSAWQSQIVDSVPGAGTASSVSYVADDLGKARIAYSDGTTMKYATYDGSAWNINAVSAAGMWPDLSLTSSGQPHVAYVSGSDIRHAWEHNGSWQDEIIATPPVGGSLGMPTSAIGTDGRLNVVYRRQHVLTTTTEHDLVLAVRDDQQWQYENAYERQPYFHYAPDMVLDAANDPHVGMRAEADGASGLLYVSRNGQDWATQAVMDDAWWAWRNSSIALTSQDQPRLAFTSDTSQLVRAYYAKPSSGAAMLAGWAGGSYPTVRAFTADGLHTGSLDITDNAGSIVADSDGKIYVLAAGGLRRFSAATGREISGFASDGSLGSTGDIEIGPDGNLYVTNRDGRGVLRYDKATGNLLGSFISDSALDAAFGMVFGPDGNLYVGSWTNNEIRRYNGTTGAFIDVFASGVMNQPGDLIFGPDGNLYISSVGSGQVLRFSGSTGQFLDSFVTGGLTDAWGLRFGDDGRLYVLTQDAQNTHRYNIVRFDSAGQVFDTFVTSASGGAGFLAFVPEPSSLTLIAAGCLAFLRCRRRHH